MVTLRYRQQQAEAEARKQRLVAARQAASSLSLRQARQYSVQKADQTAQVRRELQTRWALEQQDKAMAVDELLNHVEVHRAEGFTEASRVNHSLVDVATDELSAWAAEHALEEARYGLASAYVAADETERNARAIDGAARRAKVGAMEKARTARVVAAAPHASSAAALAEACAGMERFDQQPLHGAPFNPLRVNVPRDKRMSAVAHPPRCIPGELFRNAAPTTCEDGAGVGDFRGGVGVAAGPSAVDAAAALVRQRESDQAAQQEKIQQAQAAASARAERVLREKRAAAAQAKLDEEAERARRREVTEVYRQAQEGAGDDDNAKDPRHKSTVLPATQRQQAQQAARDAEEAFVRDFVEGPPVLVPGVPPHCVDAAEDVSGELVARRRGGVPVEVLMRPVRVQELLPDAVAQPALPAVRLSAAPLVISLVASEPRSTPILVQAMPHDKAPEAVPSEAVPSEAPVSPPEEAHSDTVAGPGAARPASPTTDECGVAPHVADTTPIRHATHYEATPEEGQQAEVDPVDVVEISRVTDATAASLSTSTQSRSSGGALVISPDESSSSRDTSEPTWIADPSDTVSTGEDSRVDTTFTSTSSSSMRPTMTAEQLKLALIRLRNRMRAAQI